MEFVRELELRHPGQIGAIRVPLSPKGPLSAEAIANDFRAAHQRLYGHDDANAAIEVAALFVVGIGRLPRVRLNTYPLVASTPQAERPSASSISRKRADASRRTSIAAPTSRPAPEFHGPAIIEESTTSVVVAPGDVCSVDALGNFLIRPERSGRP